MNNFISTAYKEAQEELNQSGNNIELQEALQNVYSSVQLNSPKNLIESQEQVLGRTQRRVEMESYFPAISSSKDENQDGSSLLDFNRNKGVRASYNKPDNSFEGYRQTRQN